MYKGKLIAVVVPAYNEEGFVGDVIETIPAFVDRIYPVDDCSTDGTWAEIRAATMRANDTEAEQASASTNWVADGGLDTSADHDRAAAMGEGVDVPVAGTVEVLSPYEQTSGDERPTTRVVPLRHMTNRGVGAAIKTGYTRALDDGMDVVAVMNGDGQMDPDILDEILNPVAEDRVEYAKGNRLVTKDHWRGMTRWRLFGNLLLTTLTRIASGYWRMTDPQNGYTAISAEALEQIELDSLYDEYGFLNDLLTRLNTHDMRIADVEMAAVYGDEDSSIRYSRFIPQLSWLLLQNFVWRLRTKYGSSGRRVVLPYLFGTVGGALLVVSLLLSVLISAQYTALGATALGLCLCAILIGVGMAFDRQQSADLEVTVRR
jgi:glycosyltransferase involved in cell wall biosynthesis